jgi:hypothetical protein
MLPDVIVHALKRYLARAREQHRRDCSFGGSYVALPDALARKYPNASRSGSGSAPTHTYEDAAPGSVADIICMRA